MRTEPTPAVLPRRGVEVAGVVIEFALVMSFAGFVLVEAGTDVAAARLLALAIVCIGFAVRAWYFLRSRQSGAVMPVAEAVLPYANLAMCFVGYLAVGAYLPETWALFALIPAGYAPSMGWRQFTVFTAVAVIAAIGAILAVQPFGHSEPRQLVTVAISLGALSAVSGVVTAGWRNAESHSRQLAETDALTGLANRRAFFQRLAQVEADPQSTFGILMLDLDHFKNLNDRLGHEEGDRALIATAWALAANLRGGDMAARYGGEEFVVVLPRATEREAGWVAERLRKAIKEATPITVSIGCAARMAGESGRDVVKRADDQLLVAKRAGRNRVSAEDPANVPAAA